MVEHDDAVARFVFGNVTARGGDDTGRLMAVDARRREQIVFDFFEIGMADAAGLDADKNLSVTDGGRADLVDRDDAVAAINGGAHAFRDNGGDFRMCSRQETLPVFWMPFQRGVSGARAPPGVGGDWRARR